MRIKSAADLHPPAIVAARRNRSVSHLYSRDRRRILRVVLRIRDVHFFGSGTTRHQVSANVHYYSGDSRQCQRGISRSPCDIALGERIQNQGSAAQVGRSLPDRIERPVRTTRCRDRRIDLRPCRQPVRCRRRLPYLRDRLGRGIQSPAGECPVAIEAVQHFKQIPRDRHAFPTRPHPAAEFAAGVVSAKDLRLPLDFGQHARLGRLCGNVRVSDYFQFQGSSEYRFAVKDKLSLA